MIQFWVKVKVKGRIDRILSRDTPLSPDTSSHQISTENHQPFRNYRAEGKYTEIYMARKTSIPQHTLVGGLTTRQF
jgi:hypothetical protein